MSQQFKVGDVCELFGLPSRVSHFNGSECTITGGLQMRFGESTQCEKVCYEIRCVDSLCWLVEPKNLRLKRPPEEPKSEFLPCEDYFSEWLNNVRSAEKCR